MRPTGNAIFFQRSDEPQKVLCRREFREEFFLFLELARVYTSSAPSQFHRVLQMQHLVKKDVFDGVSRHARVIKDAADHDGVVGGIVVTEVAAGVILAPSKLRAVPSGRERSDD